MSLAVKCCVKHSAHRTFCFGALLYYVHTDLLLISTHTASARNLCPTLRAQSNRAHTNVYYYSTYADQALTFYQALNCVIQCDFKRLLHARLPIVHSNPDYHRYCNLSKWCLGCNTVILSQNRRVRNRCTLETTR